MLKYKVKVVLSNGTKLPDMRISARNIMEAVAKVMQGRDENDIQFISTVRTCGYTGKA